jgi:uncharacterized repeat protein (TIGR03803 family)
MYRLPGGGVKAHSQIRPEGGAVNKPTLSKLVCIVFVFCAATAIASPAQILTTLHSFDGSDGASPVAGLTQATDGNLYGTTSAGADYLSCFGGCGTVFRITPSGTRTILHNFDGADGANPGAGLVQATDSNFYGTTATGGAGGDCYSGCGTVFKIAPSGVLTTLYSFCSQGNCTDGDAPLAGLIQATDGNFYGITTYGGANGAGTVFKITPSGTLTTLHSFGSTDGANPRAGLVQATDGNFYGTTTGGGVSGNCRNGCGTVFKMSPQGTLTTLHSFDGTDGETPFAGFIQATDSNFYGTTTYGGANGAGTVFKITPSGTLTTLHSFDGSDGANPQGGLIQAADGNFYRTAVGGGARGGGTVFRLVLPRPCIVCPAVE